jgi:hypothetical protein
VPGVAEVQIVLPFRLEFGLTHGATLSPMKPASLLLTAILGLIFLPVVLSAAELTPALLAGKWIATFESNRSQQITVTYVFKAQGGKLTGTASSAFTGEGELSDIKLDKDNIAFTENFTFDGTPLRFLYTGKLNGEELQLKRVGPGINVEQAGVAKRVKEEAPAAPLEPVPAPTPAK